MITPIFILSLPRSGSTLLQRLIATHPMVATTSEPWFLLPLFLGFREGHVHASYQQSYLVQAFDDFLGLLPDGIEAHRTAARSFAGSLYEQACKPGQTHFLDKTPRYHLIADDLIHTFPEARWMVLWRNPLAVVASSIDLHGGRWDLHDHHVDLYQGLDNLTELQHRYHDRVFSIQYESLVEDPDRHIQAIFRYLGLSPLADASRRFQDVSLIGRMGDKKGEQLFSGVSTASRDKWPESFATLPRRIWAHRYLRWIGRERLARAGYELDDILARLRAQPLSNYRHAIPDAARMIYGLYRLRGKPSLFGSRRALPRQEDRSRASKEQ